jgi:hypothetical protein
MFRKSSLVVFLALSAVAYVSAQPTPGPTVAEYQFISGLYASAGPQLNLVIRNRSFPVEIYLDKAVPTTADLSLKTAKKHLSGVSDETIADFNTKNSIAFQFADRFEFPGRHRLVSLDEILQLFPSGRDPYKGWKAFRKKYEAQSWHQFSRVGFNKSQDQALIYAAYDSENFSDGTYSLYVKEGGMWKRKKSFAVWRNEDN